MEEYLYDPKRSKRRKGKRAGRRAVKVIYREKTGKTTYLGRKGGTYFYSPRSHKKRYDPRPGHGRGSIPVDNLLVLAGAGVDAYLTTKMASTFGQGMSIPTIAGNGATTNVPYTELAGIVGGVALPFVSKSKMVKAAGSFLTGMGANGMYKIFDPPAEVPGDKKVKTEIDILKENSW